MSKEQPFRLGFLVHDVSRLRRTVMDKALKPYNITRSQWWALANLSRHNGQGMMQTELANVMDVGKVTLGGLIDRLEAAGFVVREPDPKDRRAKRVKMTRAGEKLLNKMGGIAEKINEAVVQDLSEKQISQIESAMHKMKTRLIEMDAVPRQSGSIK
jgi:DNA-binding MarR family transcriptional regulator